MSGPPRPPHGSGRSFPAEPRPVPEARRLDAIQPNERFWSLFDEALHGHCLEALHSGDYVQLMYLGDRNSAPLILWELQKLVDLKPRDLAKLVPLAWSAADAPLRILPPHAWVESFRPCAFEPLEASLRVYRAQRPGEPHGMSWTTNQAVAAELGAMANGLRCSLLTGVVEPEWILAVIDERDEAEIVVTPDWTGWSVVG